MASLHGNDMLHVFIQGTGSTSMWLWYRSSRVVRLEAQNQDKRGNVDVCVAWTDTRIVGNIGDSHMAMKGHHGTCPDACRVGNALKR